MSMLYPNSLQIPAMLYSKAPEGEKLLKELDSGNYIGQPKIDGAWYQLEKTDDGHIYLFGRSKSKKTGELSEKIANVPHIKEWAEEIPNGTTLIGEIFVPGGKSNDVTKIMGALPEKAIERQKGNPIHYYIHDMIRYDKHDMLDMPFERRYSDLCRDIDICGPKHPSWYHIATSLTGCYFLDRVYNYINSGGEGYVIKSKEGLYLPGKRPTYNFKIKEQQNDIDVIILDVLDPEREYTGKDPENWEYKEGDTLVTKDYYYHWKNAIQVGAYDNDGHLVPLGTVSSGITDRMKKEMAEAPENYLGQVCEIQAMSVDKENLTFRHPRYIQMRPDKNPEECKISEIFA